MAEAADANAGSGVVRGGTGACCACEAPRGVELDWLGAAGVDAGFGVVGDGAGGCCACEVPRGVELVADDYRTG